MSKSTEELIRRIEALPEDEQDEVAEVVREIECRRRGIYEMNAEEEAAVREGLAELDRGKWVSEEEMRAFWKRCGIV
jgi:predicted transcriptional regulator